MRTKDLRTLASPAARIFAIALGCLLLAGCGFHPLYATDGGPSGAREVFASIYVDPIEGERAGYELRNALINSLLAANDPRKALYRLNVTVDQYVQGIAVGTDAAVTRYNYTLNVNYKLSDMRTNKVLKEGIESSLSAYDVVASPYATLVAQHDAQKRGADDIAYRVRIDLSAFFAKRAAQK